MNEQDIMIEVNHMSHIYTDENGNDVRALDDVNLSIKRGEFVCIIGTNGSGKSTLAKHFNVLLQPSEGHINVCGFDTRDEAHIWNIRQHVGMVFQNPDNQIVAAVVEEDVAFGPENLGIPSAEIRERVDAALAAVNMTEYREHGPHLLSGGQKQRIAIAGVLAMKPDCIVLDEPTAMLDPKGRREVLETVHKLNKEEGITIVYITHFMEEAGLDVPVASEIAFKLNAKGYEVGKSIINNEELAKGLKGSKLGKQLSAIHSTDAPRGEATH
ncbi:MAG: energy-coupling factor transporter ATPase [Veillonella sp.]|nr:energy-coupling factor transporter ATPase [Veillonella sp.]